MTLKEMIVLQLGLQDGMCQDVAALCAPFNSLADYVDALRVRADSDPGFVVMHEASVYFRERVAFCERVTF